MIKKLLTLVAIGGFAMMNAQSRKASTNISHVTLENIQSEKIAALSCQTISVINPTANLSLYTVQTSSTCTGGYVFGNNCYGDQQIATFFKPNYYSTIVSPSITAVSVAFYHNLTTNKGTKGTGTVGLTIYSGTSNTVMPGSSIVTTTTSLLNVTAAQTGTSSLFIYTFTLAPTAIPATGFYASLDLPTAAGDTAVIYSQTASAAPAPGNVSSAWSNDGSGWYEVSSTTSGWGLSMNHVMFPIVCGSGIVNVSENLGLSKNINIMPNPSTGVFNVAVNMAKSENLTLNVTNALGQLVSTKNYSGISSDVIALDLTTQANGVYFLTISNGTDKMVQRLILNK